MDFDRNVMCEAINEVCRKLNMQMLDESVVRLIVEVASDCYDLGYRAGKAARSENRETDPPLILRKDN